MGSMRASLGHPDPFTLNYVEVGNEVRTWKRGCALHTNGFVKGLLRERHLHLSLDGLRGGASGRLS